MSSTKNGRARAKKAKGETTGVARTSKAGRAAKGAASSPRPARPGRDGKEWNLRLYIAGDSPRSQTALRNLRRLCDERLAGKFAIEVVDLTKRPELAKTDQIIAVPTLVRKLPEPMKRIIGDLSDADRALLLLEMDV